MILLIIGKALFFMMLLTFFVVVPCYMICQEKKAIENSGKDYGKCGIIRHHNIAKNKNGQYTCRYCGKTKLTLENELKNKNLKGKE